MSSLTLRQLNALPAAEFVARLGGVFEHSAWVAQGVASQRPFDSIDALHQAMTVCVQTASPQAQLQLIRAHPELAGKAAVRGELTEHSTREQAGAGLDQCSEQEYKALTQLNRQYLDKFGFPFILAVRGYDRAGIIAQMQRRLANDVDQEQNESLRQIYQIARYRLDDIFSDLE
ncbi:2-oxo-4-hydroxy-4-carboxy-5-ureidoimidazoline decarboxylase [Pollutimonas thiosulfatoxidans]|uniref:2-oxo-4-hydroxy-4-carboxy-5-ureidoimidazoline decarboxylase n=1 Tax=Pollutimonas thiosulfatoxidans TaxID=2028345 RepID=A0A410GBC5_9BURK|nr:2-oxo-4-hydroxy-4-carboxy-5-ureidoimidazoline decarboxylase [Pollutimonas thiosulfatoxidans]QAA93589.1 OHCU decarboxylase [Pollutimonas thiosulfatoxidans]